jgi:serine/threonine protein kinase
MNAEFAVKGYRILQELSRNRQGGRITYLASNLNGERFAIKEFLFAQKDADWSAFNMLQREINILQTLNYPLIPKYVEAFETQSGFCLVQQYIETQSLNWLRVFNSGSICLEAFYAWRSIDLN